MEEKIKLQQSAIFIFIKNQNTKKPKFYSSASDPFSTLAVTLSPGTLNPNTGDELNQMDDNTTHTQNNNDTVGFLTPKKQQESDAPTIGKIKDFTSRI